MTVALAVQGCGSKGSQKTGEGGGGEDEVNEKPTASPLFIGLERQPKSHFAIVAKFEQATLPAIQIFIIKIKIISNIKIIILYYTILQILT